MAARKRIPLTATREPRNALQLLNPKPEVQAPPEAEAEQEEAPAPTKKKRRAVATSGVVAFVVVPIRFTMEQKMAIYEEANARAMERGLGKPDMSAVCREIVAAWMGEQ